MRVVNMIGCRVGHLTVIDKSGWSDKSGRQFWICKCDCGSLLAVRGDNLRRGESTQCSLCKINSKRSKFVEKGEDGKWNFTKDTHGMKVSVR